MLPIDHLGPDYRVHNRVPHTKMLAQLGVGMHLLDHPFDEKETPVAHIIAVIDTETTGLNHRADEVIEVGILLVGLDPENRPTRILGTLNQLQQPSSPLPDIIKQVTGLTDEMLEGRKFDIEQVNHFIEPAEIIVAHNAGFDRPFFDKTFGETDKIWACSSRGDIDWKSLGYKSSGLESILSAQHFFYDAHRASIDCMATAWALYQEPEALKQLLKNHNLPQFLVRAIGSPFSCKDDLKAAGYFWNAPGKVWEKEIIGGNALENELQRLETLYGGGKIAKIVERLPHNKYKA